MTKVYELYQCKYNGEVVYVGQGARGRHRHCNSGCSHVYELNKVHFSEGVDALEVNIIQEFSSKIDAENQEVVFIQKNKPKFNKIHNGNNGRNLRVEESKTLKRALLEKPKDFISGELSAVNSEKYISIVNEFYDYFGFKMITDKSFTVFGASHYNTVNLPYLKNLSITLRTQGIVKRKKDNPYILFVKAMYVCCGIDLLEHLDRTPISLEVNHFLKEFDI